MASASTRRSCSKLSSLESARFLSNHLGASSSAAAPQCELPSGSSIRARTNTCGASVSVTTPNRKGRRKRTSLSKRHTSRTVNTGAVTSVIWNGCANRGGRKGHWHKPGRHLETCNHLPGSVLRRRTVAEFRGEHPAAVSFAPLCPHDEDEETSTLRHARQGRS